MSDELDDIKRLLDMFTSKRGPSTIYPAKVSAVNDDDTVAVEFTDGSTVDDARLKSVVKSGNKMVLIPEVGSVVLVARIENSDEYVVLAVESITEVKWQIGNAVYELDADGHLIKKGDDSLRAALVKIIEAVEQVVVLQGTSPDYLKLTAAKTEIKNILK